MSFIIATPMTPRECVCLWWWFDTIYIYIYLCVYTVYNKSIERTMCVKNVPLGTVSEPIVKKNAVCMRNEYVAFVGNTKHTHTHDYSISNWTHARHISKMKNTIVNALLTHDMRFDNSRAVPPFAITYISFISIIIYLRRVSGWVALCAHCFRSFKQRIRARKHIVLCVVVQFVLCNVCLCGRCLWCGSARVPFLNRISPPT